MTLRWAGQPATVLRARRQLRHPLPARDPTIFVRIRTTGKFGTMGIIAGIAAIAAFIAAAVMLLLSGLGLMILGSERAVVTRLLSAFTAARSDHITWFRHYCAGAEALFRRLAALGPRSLSGRPFAPGPWHRAVRG
jgi:hypothetical protein